MDPANGQAIPESAFKTPDIGLHDLRIALHGEDEGHIDRDAPCDHLLDRKHSLIGRRDLHQNVVPSHKISQLHCLSDSTFHFVGKGGCHLDGDPTVIAL